MGAPPPPPPSPPPRQYQPAQPYAGYPGPVGPRATFSGPRGLATALTVLLIICCLLSLLVSAAAGRMRSTVSDIQDGNFFSLVEVEDVEDFYTSAVVLHGLGLLATGIVFIIWFHRVRVNAEVFDPTGQRLSRGWAIGAWFTPVVNLWFPKQMANDVWRASTPWGASPGRGVVTAWWVLWVLTLVTNFAGRLQGLGHEDLTSEEDWDALETQASVFGLSGLLGVAAGILAVVFVRQLSARQQTKFGQGPMPPGGPASMAGPPPMASPQSDAYPPPFP
ncbi:DUF4328 domain-containing protein, partial [Streptomyces sp. 8K308]|uniref:DUF4328 domain-containing protein n=1 Tax=Streptomyces sp. 8K308 TaxID=2530388 RepID=UPI00104E77B4